MEIFYWPLLDLLVWGFITVYLKRFDSQFQNFAGFFLGGLILWDIFFRAQQGISISFLEEVWARNFVNLFVSPLKISEFLLSTMFISIFKVMITACLTAIIALILYSFNIFIMGISLFPFIINLVLMGWSIGIITMALILRYGQEVEVLAWGLAFLIQPFAGVFYPITVLPIFLQKIAWYIPVSHIFEGMRHVISTGEIPIVNLIWASVLNIVLISLAIALFYRMFRIVKEKGLLTKLEA